MSALSMLPSEGSARAETPTAEGAKKVLNQPNAAPIGIDLGVIAMSQDSVRNPPW